MDYKSGFFDPFPELNKSGKDRKKYSFADDYLNGIDHTNGSGSNGSGNGKGNGDFSNDSDRNGDGDRTPSQHESEDMEEDWPSAPPIDILDNIKGYEMVSFDQTMCPPPLENFDTQPSVSSPSQDTKDRQIAAEGEDGENGSCDNIDGIDRSVSQQEDEATYHDMTSKVKLSNFLFFQPSRSIFEYILRAIYFDVILISDGFYHL